MQKHTHSRTQELPIEPADPQGRSGSSVAGSHFKELPIEPAESEQNHPLLAAMIGRTTDAIIAIDFDFQVLDFNPAATTMLSWTAENALDYPCSEVLRCRNLNGTVLCGTSSCPLARALSDKQPLIREELLIGAITAQPCEVAASVTPLNLDRQPYVVFTARDISALRVLNRMRANFASMVSHELRTPLNSVHGFIELLMQGHMGELTREQRTYLGYAQEGVQQLISIAEDILLMTRSDSGQFEIKPEEVNFRVLARQVVSSLQPQALKAGVEIKKDIPSPSPLLYVDPQRMKQVLNNLVTNAIKFTPPGGTVAIAAQPYDDRFVLISVSDTGFGIPGEDRSHVFERFYQSNHRQQSKLGGYGLGLPIARLIIEQHGGEIDFETEVNRGTTFYFTAPAYRPK